MHFYIDIYKRFTSVNRGLFHRGRFESKNSIGMQLQESPNKIQTTIKSWTFVCGMTHKRSAPIMHVCYLLKVTEVYRRRLKLE